MTDAEGAQPGTATTPSTSSATAVDADGASSTDAVKVGEERKDSCVPKFDALWFCYSPVHQLQQYYITGNVDDCSSKWSALIDCLKKRTKFRDEVLLVEAETKHPLWDIRTHAEAQEFWDKSFGHLRGDGGAAAAAAAAEAGGAAEGAREGKQHSGRPTLV